MNGQVKTDKTRPLCLKVNTLNAFLWLLHMVNITVIMHIYIMFI